MESNVTDDQPERGVATWKVELFVSLALLLFGAVIAFKSWQLGAGWRDDGPGAGYFPFYIGVLVCLASAVVTARTLLAGRHDDSVFVSHAQLKLVMTVLLPSLAFVVAAQFLGLYVGSFLFIVAFMVWVGHYAWVRSIGIALAVAAIAFLMFEVWFKVPLFKGSLDPLRFLGY
jgi:putative tricarboxylic transport membrane protein